jgi:uncharacterized 2Fe-2S/4Fe-4S cluster protein (DUF4445 family)
VAQVLFQPSGRSAAVEAGTELLDAARRAGVELDAPCGGRGTCGKCTVRLAAGRADASAGLGKLAPTAVAEGWVLACLTRVGQTGLVVDIPEALGRAGAQIAAGDETSLVSGELLPRHWDFEPLAVKWCVEVPPPRPDDGLSDLDRLVRRLRRDWGDLEFEFPLAVLRTVAESLRAHGGTVTLTVVPGERSVHVIRVEPGDQTVRHFGLAIDVGTTTVSVQLVDLAQGAIVDTRSDTNDQVACGLDVISRINYAQRPERLQELRRRVLATINRLVLQLGQAHGVLPDEIANAVVSGNTTMTHLLLGLVPEYIRLEPYTPTVLETPFLGAGEVGIDINPEAWLHVSPAVGSYVGGDITAGVLCTDLATDTEEVSLFIDIGTNGELVVGNRDFLLTCACSAGPAFEGGGISCGMRAAFGAIERVVVDPASGQPSCWTIGNVRPKGICGSGMITLLAELLRTGWMDAAGKLDRARPCPAIRVAGRHAEYVLSAGGGEGGSPVVVSELDIDNLVRAKAAIYAACALLLQHAGLDFADLAHVFIGGGFGRFLDLEKAVFIGLVPDLPREKFHYIGNSSLLGSYIVLVSQKFRRRQREIAGRMTYVDLCADPRYMDQYTGALFFPHTDLDRFPSVRDALRARP